ncbi:MAG: DcaP family trimeric outer membrane transporter [Woeseiaceae bacterium]|nr:DcaP family trimeric outer membrane transporter [Woeseiaceae bacterium]
MTPRYTVLCVAAAGLLLTAPAPADAATDPATYEARISELEAKVQRLEALIEQQTQVFDASCARVEEVEEAVASCARIDDVEEAIADVADSPTLFEDTDIRVGGYVKMDAILSDYSNAPTRGAGEDFFIPSTINTSGESAGPQLNLHAKETRFWLKSYTPTGRGDISTHFEIDFLAGQQGDERVGNSFSARIRHASINWGRWTVGQTWTNFFNVATLPEYLDFIGPVGTTFARQAQVRYTAPASGGNWSFSLENPETTLTPFGGGPRIDADDGRYPDVVLRRNWTGDWGRFSAAALVRELRIGRGGIEDSTVGGAIGIAGQHRLGEDDDLRWQINAGNALGRYLGLNAFNVGALDADENIDLTPQFGVFAAYRHRWNHRLHSSFGLSYAEADNDTAISGLDVPKSYQSAHANIIWIPIERMSIGAEYIYGRREDESGADGRLNRLQLSAKYVY